MDIKYVLELVGRKFIENNIDFAIVGGVALSYYVKPRMTIDLDLMILTSDFELTENILKTIGYKCEYKSEDIATFLSKETQLGRIDFQIAHRAKAIEMLKQANIIKTEANIRLKVLQPEDLIGLKVQAYCNNPDRYYQDMADIKSLISSGVCNDFDKIRGYFTVFGKESDYEALNAGKGSR
jgi:predicted HAD superfamily hydrolase